MARKRPNPADYRFENKNDETLLREPGQISPYDFSVDTLSQCVVYLLDKIAQVTVDKVTNSRMHFGPIEGSLFLRDCENCVVTVCCGQFRAKNCKNLYIFLYSASDPSIEYSTGLIFGPYNFSYPLQDTHFTQAKLDLDHDMWSQVFDFNKSDEEHWRIMRPEEYKVMGWQKPELGDPVNPVPRHSVYGGSLAGDIKVGSQQHGVQGLVSFGFDTDQTEAQERLDKHNEDIFAETTAPSNPDYFAEDPGASNPDYFVQDTAPPKQDYFIDDNIDFGSPFDAPASAQFQEIPKFEPEPLDNEELERQRLRDLENKERNKKMMNKDEKERAQKDEKRKLAREELRKWYAERDKQILRKKELNIQAEKLIFDKRKTFPTSWKKVGSMIDNEDRKDVARMKSVLLSKKHES